MSNILKWICYIITAFGLLIALVGVLSDNSGAAAGGIQLAIVFGILSALLHVKRIF